MASSTKRNDRLSNTCLKIPVSEMKEYAHWNQHAQFTKLRFYVDSVHNKLHKGDESFYMQVQDGCVELRDRSRTAIKEVKTKERVKLEPGWFIKFHDAGELRVLRNDNKELRKDNEKLNARFAKLKVSASSSSSSSSDGSPRAE